MTATRRGLLGGAAILVAAPATPAAMPGHPDAALLAACAAFDALERAVVATYAGCPETGPAWEAAEAERVRLWDEQEPFVDRMCELRAVTREGQAARARSLALWASDTLEAEGDATARLTAAMVRDLIEGATA